MSERDFYYWLQGFFELSGSEELTKEQVKMIKDHMSLVTKKVTPDLEGKESKEGTRRMLTSSKITPLTNLNSSSVC